MADAPAIIDQRRLDYAHRDARLIASGEQPCPSISTLAGM
jgi:hypothetical protein